jgi:hypothetical protein
MAPQSQFTIGQCPCLNPDIHCKIFADGQPISRGFFTIEEGEEILEIFYKDRTIDAATGLDLHLWLSSSGLPADEKEGSLLHLAGAYSFYAPWARERIFEKMTAEGKRGSEEIQRIRDEGAKMSVRQKVRYAFQTAREMGVPIRSDDPEFTELLRGFIDESLITPLLSLGDKAQSESPDPEAERILEMLGLSGVPNVAVLRM